MEFTTLYGTVIAATLAVVTLVWMASVSLRDASIIDMFWGVLFVVMAWTLLFVNVEVMEPKMLTVTLLVTIWGLRLAFHLAMRNLGRGEDRRYALWRLHGGPSWWWKTYYRIYLLQGAIALAVATPIVAVFYRPHDLHLLNLFGLLVWLAGFVVEFVADLELTRFRARNEGGDAVMNEGLWRFSRHPNYFGDALQWWGLGLFAFSGPTAWSILGPIVMTIVFLYVSNDVIERGLKKRRPDYVRYVATTNAFFPWRPRELPDDPAESRTMGAHRTAARHGLEGGDGNQDAT